MYNCVGVAARRRGDAKVEARLLMLLELPVWNAAIQRPGRPVYGPTYTPTAPPPEAAVSLAVQADKNLI